MRKFKAKGVRLLETSYFRIKEVEMRYKHVKSNDALAFTVAGGEITKILATGNDTDKKVSIFDSKLPRGSFAPMHYHDFDDEVFYIISGKVQFGVEDQEFEANSGDLVIAGPNVRRRFKALEDTHMLVINAPGGYAEGFMRELSIFEDDYILTEEDKDLFCSRYGIHFV